VYEPEVYRFGGEAGMAVAHAHFDAGTRLVFAYETLTDEIQKQVSRLTFSLANISDLLIRSLDDEAEMWDVWHRLYSAVGGSYPLPQTHDYGIWRAVLRGMDFLSPSPSEDLRELIKLAQTANSQTANAVSTLADGGALSVGKRAWLTAASVFEWNRFGLPEDHSGLAAAVAVALHEYAPDIFYP
ncbi:MAG: thiopeptide-type bacteriocin biosynthesis protein, partial [Acidobacteria bacterium]|nr:thiopeptide-type bacteriocin biosynthesis protein [Acidobacteriota bacterium]